MKNFSFWTWILLLIAITGCGPSPSTTTASAGIPKQIKEPQLGTPYVAQTVQRVRTSNCDGLNPRTTIARSLQQGQATSFEVQVEAGGLVRGTPIPLVLEAELDARIRGALARISNTTLQDAISLDLQMDPGKEYDHNITWNETRVKGIIELIYSDATARLAFERVIGLELAGRQSNSVGCGGQPVSTVVPIAQSRTEPTVAVAPTIRLPAATLLPTRPPTTVPPNISSPTVVQNAPLREHKTVSIGTGVFAKATFSDGLAPYDENWLWANNHFNIQRIRREEQPSGCDSVLYQSTKIWASAGSLAKVTVNGSEIGTITNITPLQRHGFIVDVSLNIGDKICLSPIPDSGFHLVFGPDIYYHYDSYCYRGNC